MLVVTDEQANLLPNIFDETLGIFPLVLNNLRNAMAPNDQMKRTKAFPFALLTNEVTSPLLLMSVSSHAKQEQYYQEKHSYIGMI